jgi:hypothetical protein
MQFVFRRGRLPAGTEAGAARSGKKIPGSAARWPKSKRLLEFSVATFCPICLLTIIKNCGVPLFQAQLTNVAPRIFGLNVLGNQFVKGGFDENSFNNGCFGDHLRCARCGQRTTRIRCNPTLRQLHG